VYRRAYALLVGIALVMGALAVIASLSIDKKLVDPEGFLGPSWLRLPLLVGAAFALDLVPRTLWLSKFRPADMAPIFRMRVRTHWTRERLTLVVMGLVCFYITYVSYRNLKSFLPFVMGLDKYDRTLHLMDRALMFGHEPGVLLHDVLGTSWAAYFLSYVYLWFLPLVPLALTAWLIWSKNITFGYWFATSQCIAWALGTLSYYALPTLGPGLAYSYIYGDLPNTPTSQLMEALQNTRREVVISGLQDVVQSVAGFASLHCAITLLVAMMIQYTVRNRVLRIVFWVNFGLTVVATIYFGWHYIADDLAGVMIALVAFYVGGIASGQKFERHGMASHPTADSAAVPVLDD
jgi:PAP2 superfamily